MSHETVRGDQPALPLHIPSASGGSLDDECIHVLFERVAARATTSPALVYLEQHVSYQEVNARANQLAHYLRGLGVGPEVAVGLAIERSPAMIIGLLAILKAGGAFVPLDPAYPQERLNFLLSDARICCLLTQRSLRERFAALQPQVTLLEVDGSNFEHSAATNLIPLGNSENLAYIIYTSGSTGIPKGVEVPQRGICNLVKAQAARFQVQSSDRILQFASLSFDAALAEIFVALLSGATLVLAPGEALRPGPPLIETIARYEVTMATLPPSVLAVLPEQALPTLKTLISAGEACTPMLVERWSRGRAFFNAYGPTEATVCATIWQATDAMDPPALGSPLANTRISVLDAALRPVPVGTSGELYIGGRGVARGYRHRPALTAGSFLPDPFSEEPGARLYKTGDLVCTDGDGRLTFLGRSDWQVKLRGFRIELGEIEAALCRHPAVEMAVVLLREDVAGEPRLVAYLTAEVAPWELRALLHETLPDYMIPDTFVQLTAWPLTPTGKIDRHALPVPDETNRTVLKRFVAPRTHYEEQLAAIWSEVLHLKQIGIYDSFFELGGHSLQATRVVARVREVFQVELPLDVLFRLPTIAEVAAYIEQGSGSQHRTSLPALSLARTDPLPLSFSQELVWFLRQLHPASLAYNAQVVLRLLGKLDHQALERSLNEIVRRHEIFRTTFPARAGQPIQVIHESMPVRLALHDLRNLPADEREQATEQAIYELFQQPFDITRLPLIRWTLLRVAEEEHLLVHVEHHLVHDGWSFGVFLRELRELYTAYVSGRTPDLPALPLQFADLAVWQRRWMETEEAQEQLTYWRQRLAGCPELLTLPTDHPRPAVQRYRGSILRAELPQPLCNRLRAFCLEEGKTLYMVMLSAFLILLHRYSGQDDLCVGSGIANRRWRETETIIGMLINMVVLRNDLSGNPTFRELLERVQEVTLGAYVHQDLPFGKIVEALRPERSLSYPPLYQVAFSFHDSPLPDLHFHDVQVELLEGLSNGSAKFDMNVIAIPQVERRENAPGQGAHENILLTWEYNSDLFDVGTIQRMVVHYQEVLNNCVLDQDQGIDEVPLLTMAERAQIIETWNATISAYPREQCIHQLFEAQAQRTPEAVALVHEDQRMSYRALNEQANRLAAHLREIGIGPEAIAGVYVERSPTMVVALLAILKAGGAYLLLDPTLPRERLAFILQDAHATVLLTQRRLQEHLPTSPARLVFLDALPDPAPEQQARQRGPVVQPENLAYVVYTSGSSGRPKGVQIPHRGLVNLVCWHQRAFALTPMDKATQLANLGFDATCWELWPYLTAGACVALLDEETRRSPALLRDWLAEQTTTICFLPTPLAEHMLALAWPQNLALRCMLTGGDRLRVFPPSSCPFVLVNNYGPTECSVVATSGPVPADGAPDTFPSLGCPIANTQVYVLDQQLQPVPIGVAGELYISGDGLARGYQQQPALTAARFLPHPFSTQPGARLYKSGDLARWRPDGQIEFLGRSDTQVNIRGFRVETGEVEAVLGQHPAIQQCVVVTHEPLPGDKRLIAYIVPLAGQAPDALALRDFLARHLPAYMIPSAFIPLETLPVTENGKVDYQALPAPEQLAEGRQRRQAAPRNEVEERLAAIWAEVLGLPSVGIDENFFALGGHSLLATRVMSRIHEAFQIELPLRSLFEAPTIAALGTALVQAYVEATDSETLQQALHELASEEGQEREGRAL